MHTKPRNLVAGHPGYPQDARNQGLSPRRSRKDAEEVRDIRELSGEARMCAIPEVSVRRGEVGGAPRGALPELERVERVEPAPRAPQLRAQPPLRLG